MRTSFMQGVALCAVTGGLLVAACPAAAQSAVDADLQRYCREKFNNAEYRPRPERWGVEHYCMQGGTPQTIDYDEACRLTTGARDFRKDGARVLCTGGAPQRDITTRSGSPNFSQYCKDKFANSEYERRAEPWGVVHYCRRPGATGGFTLQTIDLAEACEGQFGTRQFSQSGASVSCQGGRDVASNDRLERPGPRPGPGPRPPLPFPEPQVLPQPAPGPTSEQGERQLPARANDDGRLKRRCTDELRRKWRSGTIPMVEKIVSGIQGRINSTTACQRERHGDRRFKGACSVFEGGRIYTYAYTEIYNIWWGHIRAIRCAHQFSLEDVRKAREEACIIEETLSDLKAHIHKIEPHVNLLDYKEDREGRGGIHDPVNPCAHGTVRYVRADGTRIAEGTALPFLERLQVEVEFDRDMKRSRRELNIVTDHGSFSITAVQQGARLYVGEHPVVFAPSSPPKR